MRPRLRRERRSYALTVAAAAVLAVIAAVLGGCGVPLQQNAEPVPGVVTGSPTSSLPATGDTVRLWFVADGRLVPYAAQAADPLTVASLVDGLAAGPPRPDPGVRSLVVDPGGSGSLVTVPEDQRDRVPGGTVTVQLSDAFAALPPTEQLLLLGQVVLTLTEAGAEAVQVTNAEGVPVAVPLPDGRVLEGPATRADYAALTAGPSRSTG